MKYWFGGWAFLLANSFLLEKKITLLFFFPLYFFFYLEILEILEFKFVEKEDKYLYSQRVTFIISLFLHYIFKE